ncbi:uncharacterized protein LOC119605482 [Lucilia sericata]|uniref:uncharacterized protein LOC119605482 n=1 Tax=Lucilia sericata TaxID=13632 RepID=UPI0018A7FBE8|nr:uncharacterized protein LOC119605482 [Lucilia sericata]
MENINTDEFKDKNDGMHLIVETSYSLSTLQEFMNQTCLADKCEFLQHTEDIEEICKKFRNLLINQELNLDEITNLFVAASMIYFINATPENFEWRSHLLQKTFQYVDTLSPMHLHVATKRLWNAFQTEGIEFVFNILTISHHISLTSETGRAIAICLVWTLICEITETEIQMCSFHKFSELIKMLEELDDELLQEEEHIRIVFVLVQCLGFVINAVVYGKNDDLKKAGYSSYFSYTQRELEKLKKYAERLTSLLKINISGDNNFELRMTITEYININIIGILQEKISEMQTI